MVRGRDVDENGGGGGGEIRGWCCDVINGDVEDVKIWYRGPVEKKKKIENEKLFKK